jgi:chorismate mutase-like protein
MKVVLLFSLLLFSGFCSDSKASGSDGKIFQPSTGEDRLVDTLIRRLQISREVAWTKFANHQPVADPKREETLLSAMTAQGEKIGLSSIQVTALFQAQIMASRKVQEELIEGWNDGKSRPVSPPKNLMTEIRPQVIQISLELLRNWKEVLSHPTSAGFQDYAEDRVIRAGFSAQVAALASRPLHQ